VLQYGEHCPLPIGATQFQFGRGRHLAVVQVTRARVRGVRHFQIRAAAQQSYLNVPRIGLGLLRRRLCRDEAQ
jgi:hypothetical protein